MASLTATARKNLPASKFALPGRRYPIDTANRARSALARASEFATATQRGAIQRKVKKSYPGIQVAGTRTLGSLYGK